MKKTTLLVCLLGCMISGFVTAQNSQSYRLTHNSYDLVKLSYQFDVQDLQVKNIKTERGTFSQLSYAGMTPTRDAGKPELPLMTQLMEIPLCDDIQVNIIHSDYVIYNCNEIGIEHPLMPVQPEHPKSEDGPFPFVIDDEAYNTNDFYGKQLAQADIAGVLRNINLGHLSISPFSYNPVSGELKIYTRIDVEISFVNPNIPKTMEMKTKHGNGLFDGQHCGVINPMSSTGYRNEIDNAPIKYLIIAHSMFRENENLTSFINWKKRIGYLVELAYTSDSGVGTTTTSIKNFIKAKYDNATAENPAPTFVLLIGDVAQIPVFTGVSDNSHVTDLYYVTWTSGDNLPDCYIGRFSAQNINQLTPQIEKTLMYEQYTMPDHSYLNDAVAVAGTDSYYGPRNANYQINYLTNNYLNNAYGFQNVHTHLYNCSSQAATIRSEIGAGVGYANYTAHCSSDGWSDPVFENNHVPSMNNANKYGIMIGNCCLSGKFDDNSCFGETLLRTANKGAVIYLGASNSTYWTEDYYWSVGMRGSISEATYDASHLGAYDRLFHTHNEAHDLWYVTSAGINMAGNLAVESSSTDASMKLYYWEIYHVFGDPSIKPYLTEPEQMLLNIPNSSIVGTSELNINVVPYAYVALTKDNELVSAAFADANGNASLSLPADMVPGEYELAVSAQNYVQFFQTINFASPTTFYAVSSLDLNNNGIICNNNINSWDLRVENVSVVNGSNVRAKIEALSANIYFTVDSVYIGNLSGNQVINLNEAFTSRTTSGINDGEIVSVKLTIYSDNGNFERNFNYNAIAPALQVNDVILNSGTSSEGELFPGETGTITFFVRNSGHNNINNLIGTLNSHHGDITVTNGSINVNLIGSGDIAEVTFTITVAANASSGNLYPLMFTLTNTEYVLNYSYNMTTGRTMEDFESNSFNSFAWSNDANYPWQITTSNVYAGSYSARSNSNLPDGTGSWWNSTPSTSDLSITLNVTKASPISYFRKVSSEESYDIFTFAIDGTVKEELSGEEPWGQASFTVVPGNHTFRFRYSKDGSQASGSDCAWIDNIIFPISGQTISPSSPMLTIDHYDIEGSYAGNIVLNGNEPIIKVTFNNEGNTVANNIEATLSTSDNNIMINGNASSDVLNYSSMAINSSKTAQYSISNVNTITETQNVFFDFTLSSGGTSISCPILLTYINGTDPGSISDPGTSIDTHSASSLLIYPNPSSDQLYIQCSSNMKSVEIIDITGRSIKHINNIDNKNYSLNISDLSSSIYFVKVLDVNNQPIISKIIKK